MDWAVTIRIGAAIDPIATVIAAKVTVIAQVAAIIPTCAHIPARGAYTHI